MSERCLIISGGSLEPSPYYKRLAAAYPYVICADGGARYAAALGIIPQLVLGDFDTLSEQEIAHLEQAGTRIQRYSPEKDFTDTHLAILEALQLGFTEIDLIAALGGCFGHTLANVMLLALPEAAHARLRILEEDQEIFLVRNKKTLTGRVGERITLLPLTDRVEGITLTGLKFPLTKAVMTLGVSIGVSNAFAQETAQIELEKGILVAIQQRKKT
ncbi:MAG: thiamine diphosphokinase [Clostridia bacterium]|jgi:thiamine pyrophosphokinase|nr:thiamine diphosphokinase [Clostridia bacterium]